MVVRRSDNPPGRTRQDRRRGAAFLTAERFNGGDFSFRAGQLTNIVGKMARSARPHFAGEHTARANRGLNRHWSSSERVAIEVASAVSTTRRVERSRCRTCCRKPTLDLHVPVDGAGAHRGVGA